MPDKSALIGLGDFRGERNAFSLIELLVVIAVIGILAVAATPAIQSILGGRGLSRAVNDVASVLEFAKAEALTRRTYVYVGFTNVTNGSGNSELRIASVASGDGSSSNLTTNNLQSVSKLLKIQNARFVGWNEIPPVVQALAQPDQRSPADYVGSFPPAGFSFQVGGQDFTGGMIVFSPTGDLLSTPSSRMFRPMAAVALMGTRGTQLRQDDAAIVAYHGSTGRIEIIRQ